jgi:hypothetical protein
VLTAATTSPSTLSWKRWERGKYGNLAVFSYRTASANIAPEITFCCLPEGDGTALYQNKADTYGEFAVNQDTGAILRIVINADLDEERDPDVPLIRSQLTVEYGPEELGGKTYICPQRSVEISRGRSERELGEWGMVFSQYGYFETMINDVTFGGYHKFGSEARILTGFEETEETKTPAPKTERAAIAQPSAIDAPDGAKLVTVAQLTEIVANAKGKDNSGTAKEIEHLRLMERLSSTNLAALSAELPGTKSKNALMAVADASVFLEPPANENPNEPIPDMAERDQIVTMAVDYLKEINPKLPNFYAKRLTTSFEETLSPKDEDGSDKKGVLHPVGKYTATVYYREGKEVVQEGGAREHGLITRGIFGPILSVVILDAAHSHTTQWSRWEEGPNGTMAVFQFQVPRTASNYEVSDGVFGMMDLTAYHGEIGIDPSSGTILRLTVEADPELGSAMERADIMVEYGPVEIGGKIYTCPVRSVSYSVGTVYVPVSFDLGTSSKRNSARLNDVVFSDYHVFRSEMRVVQ